MNVDNNSSVERSRNIPKGWVETTLGEVGLLARGKSKHRPRWASHLFGGKYPFIQTGQVKSAQKYITTYEQTYSDDGLAQSKLWNEGTLCITIAANIAEIAILGIPACFPDSVLGFIPDKEKSDLDFIYYYFSIIQARLRQLAIGSVQDNINLGTFDKIVFTLPPLKEQVAIAQILTSFDDKIALLQAQNNTLETTAQTIFKEWFGKYQIGDELPDGWRVGKLSEIGKIICGKTPSKSNKEYYGNDIPFIKIPDMHNQMFIINTIDNLSLLGANSQKKKIIPANSICISCIATVGLVSLTIKDSQTNQQINTIIPNDEFLREFLYFKLSKMTKYLNDLGSGGTATLNVNTSTFSNIEIVIPNEEKLDDFHLIVKPVIDKILDNSTQIQTLKKTRDTLLPKLMSGQIRVDEFKEPAI